ncbi:MAG TPA: uroporphyrinogen-III C-methyltransferase [Blastocatellia bacterium]|nr:uroporphyrinogen-III C-methyltransferase [Blastocatellia bacterium]
MNDALKTGKVYLIGAGPGDPKLLTLKAAEAIDESDVIVYDHLVNPEILAHSRRGAELVYVGKRAGEPSISQSQINRLLMGRAQSGQIVARLKGGDPFIFGRGGEEAEALANTNIQFEVIPGVSSGIAAAAYAGIPLTHRDYASSVAFITGHDAAHAKRPAVDWSITAHAADTLVVFMCAQTIARIAREIIASGRPATTPIAIIRWGTYQHQEVFTGTLEDLVAADELCQGGFTIEPPAIAVIGDVVRLADKLAWFGASQFGQLLGTAATPLTSNQLEFV